MQAEVILGMDSTRLLQWPILAAGIAMKTIRDPMCTRLLPWLANVVHALGS